MGTVKAQIVEGITGEPLVSATVKVVDVNGAFLGQGVMTDTGGKFTLTSTALNGNYLLISYAGLAPVMIATDLLNDRDYKVVQLLSKELEPVVVTPGHKTGVWWWILLLGIPIVVVVSNKKKNKKAA
jgi:hypothetical protein